MTELQKGFIKYLARTSKNDSIFLSNIKQTFSISTLCYILNINRNRYNYLVRNNKLDQLLLDLKNDVINHE